MFSLTPDEVDKSISGDTAKLYRMIWSRFMASQMADCQQDTVSVTVSAVSYTHLPAGAGRQLPFGPAGGGGHQLHF